jgi:hypothetical protein
MLLFVVHEGAGDAGWPLRASLTYGDDRAPPLLRVLSAARSGRGKNVLKRG